MGFTTVDDKQPLSSIAVSPGEKKRVHLNGVGTKQGDIKLRSSDGGVVTPKLTALFDGKKGIWTVDLQAGRTGTATVTAEGKNPTATLSVFVEKRKVKLGFTTGDDKSPLSAVRMHAGKTRRVHLRAAADKGAPVAKGDLILESSNDTVAQANLKALYNGERGIWTVDLTAGKEGSATVTAAARDADGGATLSLSVEKVLSLPDKNTEAGMLARLLLAESGQPGAYDRAETKRGMQWMKLVLQNRLKEPRRYSAPGAGSLIDIVKAEGQFAGFESYPTLKIATIDDVLGAANDDNSALQEQFITFTLDAVEVANAPTIDDPTGTRSGLIGWRTRGSGSPGPNFVAYGKPLAGNQFYTLK